MVELAKNLNSVCEKLAKSSRWMAQKIRECSRKGHHKEVLSLFRQLQSQGHRSNTFLLPTVLRSCAAISDVRIGGALHGLVTRSFSSPAPDDAFIAAALIDMYSKCGRVHYARRVFDKTPHRDLVLWNSMLSGYAHQGLPHHAMAVHRAMRSHGVAQDIVSWNALISGFSRTGDHAMAVELFSAMQLNGFEPDVFSWTMVISALVHNFRYGKAFAMFKQMVATAGVQPSSFTVSSLLPACANALDLKHGKELHGYAVAIGMERDLYVSSSLVDMYAKCGLIFDAGKVFDKMTSRNVVSWNSMIFGFANHGYCEDAIRLFYHMKEEEGVAPDHLTFTAVFTACSHAGMVELGRELFVLMQQVHGIMPRMEHYACMVDLLGRAGKLSDAYCFIKEMPMKPDAFVWGALLGACRNYGSSSELAEEAASHLSELEPGSAGSRVLLSSILVDAGRWGDAFTVKKAMKKGRRRRFAARSWTQVA